MNKPASLLPAADNPNGPTYAAFANIATYDNNGYRDASHLGQPVSATLDSESLQGVAQLLAALLEDAPRHLVEGGE